MEAVEKALLVSQICNALRSCTIPLAGLLGHTLLLSFLRFRYLHIASLQSRSTNTLIMH